MDGLLEDAESNPGAIEIVTSIISTAEVAYASHERAGQVLDPEVEAAIDNLWLPGAPIRLIEAHRKITDEARSIIREAVAKGWTGLRANDAIHLATAKVEGVDEFHTYEPKLVKYTAITGFRVCEPYSNAPRMIPRERPISMPPSSQGPANP